MKAANFILAIFISSLFMNASAQKNFRLEQTIKPGEYYFNTTDLYFFDDGINCYLLHKCNDLDSVFDTNAEVIKVTKDQEVSYQAYLFTDNYEYIYTRFQDEVGWMRIDIDLEKDKKEFLKTFLNCDLYKPFSQYVEVVPFKEKDKVFVSNAVDWYILNLSTKKSVKIGTKKGKFQACQMLYPKNCVKCYIDLGWGEEIYFDSNGKKKKVKNK